MRLALSPALRLAVPSILGTASAFLTTLSAAEAALLGAVVIRLAAWFSGEPLPSSAARRRERFSDSDLVLHALEHAWSDGCFSGCL